MNPPRTRRFFGKSLMLPVFVGWAWQPIRADFFVKEDVKGGDDLVRKLMSQFRSIKENTGVFATLNRDVEGLSALVLIRMENRFPAIYVAVVAEHSSDHGQNSQVPKFLIEFPLRTRVKAPVVSYTLDASKVAELAEESAFSVSMISTHVRQEGTNMVTLAASYLRFEFDKEEALESYLESLAPLLLDKKHGEGRIYISGTRETDFCAQPPPANP
jgi:hypothetical protein